MKICQAILNLWSENTKIVNTQREITPKVGKPELRFMCSACHLIVCNIFVNFHENMSSGFKVMEQTLKLLTDTQIHTDTEKTNTRLSSEHTLTNMPTTAISKRHDRVDTSVWWKWPFSIFFIIYYVQKAIINKVCKPELWFLCSAHPITVLYICMKFHKNISNEF